MNNKDVRHVLLHYSPHTDLLHWAILVTELHRFYRQTLYQTGASCMLSFEPSWVQGSVIDLIFKQPLLFSLEAEWIKVIGRGLIVQFFFFCWYSISAIDTLWLLMAHYESLRCNRRSTLGCDGNSTCGGKFEKAQLSLLWWFFSFSAG